MVLADIQGSEGIQDAETDAIEVLMGVVPGKAILDSLHRFFTAHSSAPVQRRKIGEDWISNEAPLPVKAPKRDHPSTRSARRALVRGMRPINSGLDVSRRRAIIASCCSLAREKSWSRY